MEAINSRMNQLDEVLIKCRVVVVVNAISLEEK